MASYRVVVRVPDGDDVPLLVRGARTVFASHGDGTAAEVVDAVCDAAPRAVDVHTATDGSTWECGAVFGRRGARRVYLARTPEDVPAMLEAMRSGEAV